jgi:hypothetical protein
MKETNHFIFIVTDTENISGKRTSANDICSSRMSKKMWPLFERTYHRKTIKKGDVCIFYIGGYKDNCQHVVAIGNIESSVPWTKKIGLIDHEDVLSGHPYTVLNLTNINILSKPVNIKNLLGELSFIPPNKAKWGLALQGGVRKIIQTDFEIIINSAK